MQVYQGKKNLAGCVLEQHFWLEIFEQYTAHYNAEVFDQVAASNYGTKIRSWWQNAAYQLINVLWSGGLGGIDQKEAKPSFQTRDKLFFQTK